MFDIGWSELLVIAIVAIVVVGPKDLPKLMRTFGFYAGKVRRMAGDFQRQFQEAMAESEADEVRKNIESIRANMGTNADFGAPVDKPVMTGEPARTALGAPPLGAREAVPEPETRGSAARAPSKTKPARAKPPAKKTKAKAAANKTPANKTAVSKTAAKPPTKPPAKRKTKAKAKPNP